MANFDAEKLVRELKKELENNIPKTINIRLDEMELFDDNSPELDLDYRCSESDRWKCKRAIRRATILELLQKGYLNEKFFMTKDRF